MLRLTSLEEFNRLLNEGDKLPAHAREALLCKYYLDPPEPIGEPDPFSSEYKVAALRLYSEITGVADYQPEVNERSTYLNAKPARPYVYQTGDSKFLGDFLSAAGHILQVMDVRRGDSILEYGSGEGQLSLFLARMGCDVSAVDLEQRYLDAINEQARQLEVKVRTKHGLFGDGFGEKFDRILFYRAFHHSVDHQKLLPLLRDQLKPGGSIVFSGEPIIEPDSHWSRTLTYPWGPRLDGLSLAAMRTHGWCELGFQRGYFIDALMRAGFLVRYHPCPGTSRGDCYVASLNAGAIDLGKPWLFEDWKGNSGWHDPEPTHRWTSGPAVIPLAVNIGDVVEIELANLLPIHREVTIRVGLAAKVVSLIPGEERILALPIVAPCLHIESEATPIALVNPDSADPRFLGIAVRAVRFCAG